MLVKQRGKERETRLCVRVCAYEMQVSSLLLPSSQRHVPGMLCTVTAIIRRRILFQLTVELNTASSSAPVEETVELDEPTREDLYRTVLFLLIPKLCEP